MCRKYFTSMILAEFGICAKQKNTIFIRTVLMKSALILNGPSIKYVCSQREGDCPVRTFFGQEVEGSSNADVRIFWCKKHAIFQILWCVRTDKGVEPVRIFCGQGGGVTFSRFCANVFYGRPLTVKKFFEKKKMFWLFEILFKNVMLRILIFRSSWWNCMIQNDLLMYLILKT